MTKKILFVIDPIASLKPFHDTSVGMMQAALALGLEVFVCEIGDLRIENARACSHITAITMDLKQSNWYQCGAVQSVDLAGLDYIIMRKDPPVTMAYIYATTVLSLAQQHGAVVANEPLALRSYNEKLLIAEFGALSGDYLVTSALGEMQAFIAKHEDVVIKPLDGMGGMGISRITPQCVEPLADLSKNFSEMIMLMPYIPEVTQGDKRILLVHGEPVPYALLRVPPKGQLQANLALGGEGKVVPLSAHDLDIAAAVKPFCMAKGLSFVGLDVIGQTLTEVNITSVTCMREIEAETGLDIAGDYIKGLMV